MYIVKCQTGMNGNDTKARKVSYQKDPFDIGL